MELEDSMQDFCWLSKGTDSYEHVVERQLQDAWIQPEVVI
jgi:hypothetical protein